MSKSYDYTLENYQKKKPFSSFLSGIAGKEGTPLWSFYVNRGQAIASFGIENKNKAIMEFYPANQAYHYVPTIGFRTFIKIDGMVHEAFLEKDGSQSMSINKDALMLEQKFKKLGITIRIIYHTLPNEPIAGLVRSVEIINHKKKPIELEIVDGLAQILPSGIDHGGYKAVSNLLQSWMSVEAYQSYVYYTLRASTNDSSEIQQLTEGNFYYNSQKDATYIYDYKLIFEEDTSLKTPYGFQKQNIEQMSQAFQVPVNQVPCAMSGMKQTIERSFQFHSLIGHVDNRDVLESLIPKFDEAYFQSKQKENYKLHQDLVSVLRTKTSQPMLDRYLEQCYLDNVLRGGVPTLYETKEQKVAYHLFSRKHGDLERDYNFFSLEPNYYSQGNGNFRDVLQNRRNDLLFHPEVEGFNIYQFASLIQADGYNPLSVEGVVFHYEGNLKKQPEILATILQKAFTPGMIAKQLKKNNLPIEKHLVKILKESRVEIKAAFGEGYWNDHFTYLYDAIDVYQSVYPDLVDALLAQGGYPFFKSPVEVVPRSQKHVLTKDQKVRQYGSVLHHHGQQNGWLSNKNGLIHVTLYSKLLTLVTNKYGLLDPIGVGLSYEADKPGWNDATNGLPGLFGSGFSETIELKKLVDFLILHTKQEKIEVLTPLMVLMQAYQQIQTTDLHQAWDERTKALETYREALKTEVELASVDASQVISVLLKIQQDLDQAIEKAKTLGDVVPTYLTFEATEFKPLFNQDGSASIGNYGLPTVEVKQFAHQPIAPFLEAPARYLKRASKEEAKTIYEQIKQTEMYDKNLKFYQTSVSLDAHSHEIGRIRAFTKGWLERESNFLHMTYKYLVGLIKAKQYDAFYEEIKTNLTCYMDVETYGRSPLENSSFIAPSNNPDPKKRGQGFVSRLSGSTAEVLSMWRYMFLGDQLFEQDKHGLSFTLSPKLPGWMFKDGIVETTLFSNIRVVYHNSDQINTYDKDAIVVRIELTKTNGQKRTYGSKIQDEWTKDIRKKNVFKKIDVYIEKGGRQ